VPPIVCWAAIVRGPRSEWIHPFTIAPQLQDSRRIYSEQWIDKARAKELIARKQVRFAKVRIEVVQ
jgi:hypothetical protein